MKKLIIPMLSILFLTNCPQKGGSDFSAIALLGLARPATEEPPLPTPTIRLFVGETSPVAVLDGGTFDTGSAPATAEGLTYSVTILNNGEATLTLSLDPPVLVVGSNPGQFTIEQPSDRSIEPGDTSKFSLKFTPTSIGSKSAQLQIASNDPNTPTFRLNLTGSATAAPEPEIEVWKGSTNMDGFGRTAYFPSTQEFLSSEPVLFTIHNKGSAALNISEIALIGSNANQFSLDLSATTLSLPPSGTTVFSVTFTPQSSGTKEATLRILNNDSNESTYSFAVRGYASATPAPVCQVLNASDTTNIDPDGTFDFGNQIEQTIGNANQFKIENQGNATLNLTGTEPDLVVLSGTDADQFEISVQPVSAIINSYSGTTFSVRFKPTSLGTKTAILSIPNNDTDRTPYLIHLKGQGVPVPAPQFRLKYGSTYIESGIPFSDFPSVRVNGVYRADFVVENTGTATLTVENITTLTGPNAREYSAYDSYNMGSIAPGAKGDLSVSFRPKSAGIRSVRIRIDSNDATQSPFYFDINGTAYTPTDPCMELSTGVLSRDASSQYVTGIGRIYYSPTIPLMVSSELPSVVYFVEQPHTLTNPPAALATTYWNGPTPASSTYVWYSKDGIGTTNFVGMMPYGPSSKEYFTTLMDYDWQVGTYSPLSSFVAYMDVSSPESFYTTPASYSLVRGCHSRLIEEEWIIRPAAGTTSTHGLDRNWTNRKNMRVNLIFVEGTYENPTVAGIQQAVDRMKSVFAQNTVKIDLTFTATTISAAEFQTIASLSDDRGTLTGSLSRLYHTSAASQDPKALNIFFTSDNSELPGVLGISSGIPGMPGVPGNKRGAMTVFIEMHRSSGSVSSVLSPADLQFMGDTMAHEAGHFLGLFHTNEMSGYNPDSPFGYNAKDALPETPYCLMSNDLNGDSMVDLSECQGTSFTDSGASNLMFWVGDGILPQTQLTGEQGWVLRNHPLVY